MIPLLARLTEEVGSRSQAERLAREPKPMLAVLADEQFSDPEWIFERKFDGERALAVCDGTSVSLVSRNGKDISPSYPELVEALENRSGTCWIRRRGGWRDAGGEDCWSPSWTVRS